VIAFIAILTFFSLGWYVPGGILTGVLVLSIMMEMLE
jgi:hypothetical protein